MSSFRPDWAERILRGRTKAYTKGFAKGYETGAKEMAEYLSEQIIYSINQDAVLRMTADVDTLERVVEILSLIHI